MPLDPSTLMKQMVDAALSTLGKEGAKTAGYLEGEFTKLAEVLVQIETGRASGQFSEKKAEILLRMQERSARSVLRTCEGLTILAIEKAVNAALAVVQAPVNAAVGFKLL